MNRVALASIASLLALPLLGDGVLASGPSAPAPQTGAAAPSPIPAGEAERILQATPDPDSFARHLRFLTEQPHRAGTPRDMRLADYVRDRFIEYGLEEVHFHDTPALLSSPRSASVEIVVPVHERLKLREDPIEGDQDSHLYDDPSQIPYHEYAADGDVTAEVVYANSGSPEDFERLDRLGIDVRGRIVLMRYSEPYSYRGYKVYQAEAHGAAGAIIYSDPQDDGYALGDVYPEGGWGPPTHIQWGSIVYDWFGFGEPFTFHWRRGRDGRWVEGPRRDRQLPRIPSLPMSYEDAAEILSRLAGLAVPTGWQGGLGFAYHVGPGPVRVRLRVDNDEAIGTMRNVIGLVRGREEPDRWVVIGNHRDAWIYGAVDPSSGTAALLEVARSFGAALRAGLRPRRSVVFANWDAEEDLLGGSTSWVKDRSARLLQDGVAYVNVDYAAAGPRFYGGATPELADFLEQATRAVADPGKGGSIHDSWAARSEDGVVQVDPIVGATDYTAFLEHLGMSCIDMLMEGPYGVYHSQYDDYAWLSRVGDPGFRYNTAMARLWGLIAWRLADAELLPMRYSTYARAMPAQLDAVEAKAAARGPVRLQAARAAALRWEEEADAFETALRRRQADSRPLPAPAVRRVNDLLLRVSRAMTEPEGLQGRPFFKHLIYAPQPTYRAEVLPRLSEAIDAGDLAPLPRYEAQLQTAFLAAADLLRQARSAVEESGP
jgi:N-acetylated-alpha-linked acidic dipeptidase